MWRVGGQVLSSRLLLGTAQYPSLHCLKQAIEHAGTQVITVSLKREQLLNESNREFGRWLSQSKLKLLPNTAGCFNAQQAVTVAEMARALYQTHWIKLEIYHDQDSLAPNIPEVIKAAEQLLKSGFEIFPYCNDDLTACRTLFRMGCRILMPGAAPIGSGQGLVREFALKQLREQLPDALLIIDAGIGSPQDALQAMLMGFDAVLLNTAIAKAHNPIKMAAAFKHAIKSGRLAFQAKVIPQLEIAVPSTALGQTLFGSL